MDSVFLISKFCISSCQRFRYRVIWCRSTCFDGDFAKLYEVSILCISRLFLSDSTIFHKRSQKTELFHRKECQCTRFCTTFHRKHKFNTASYVVALYYHEAERKFEMCIYTSKHTSPAQLWHFINATSKMIARCTPKNMASLHVCTFCINAY